MSDPYAPQPPYQPDPYQQQPQQQPYGAPQPGFSQQPSSEQPGYSEQSSYEQPSYGQPAYQQPSYPQPDYNAQPGYAPQPYPGQPGWGAAPTPPPKKNRTALIVTLVVAAVALVVCGGIVAIAVNLDSNKTTPGATASGGPSATGPKSSSGSSASAGKTPTLTAPETIGTWKKAASQDQADALSKSLSDAGVTNPFAAQYQDTTKATKIAAVWGGTGAIFSAGGAQRQLDAFFTGMGKQLNGGQATTPITVDPGSIGGKAECAKTSTSGVTFSACAWVGTNVLLAFLFNGTEPDAAGTQVRLMLPAMVVTT
jgi:hypothetical protein